MKIEELLILADEFDCKEYFDPMNNEFDIALVKMVQSIVERKPKVLFSSISHPGWLCPLCYGLGDGCSICTGDK